MAEIAVSAVVGVLIEKLVSGALMKFARSQGIHSQLIKWKRKLLLIQAVLADAGQKEITQKAVELWLIELQGLAYDIDDVLDDIATEVMKRELKQQESHASTTNKLLNFIPACCTNFTPHNFMYGRQISSKMDDITIRLHDLFDQKNDLGLNVNHETSTKTNKQLEETSLLPDDVSEILGREGDKEALMGKLLGVEASNNHNVKIVSIVGLGGVGKTTLARVLYNDEQVKTHFELRAWICVSDEFDVFNVSKAIYQAVCGENKEFANLDLLHVALKEKLSNKRFLLVLDDVWNEDHKKWQVLKRPLVGAPGSKVIVTTRNTMVASVMGSVQPHILRILEEEVSFSLFAQYALEEKNFDKHPSLKSIAECIVKKCDGLPLALVTLGSVLKAKGSDDVKWEELLKSEIWTQEESDILPALKLSYYHLPSHLKQVFAYCSLFSKDYVFEKNKLVLLWMAQGFLSKTTGDKSMESLGRQYFEELLSRSFFQHASNDELRYTMHDLLNDLAVSVAGGFFFLLDDKKDLNGRNEDFEKFRHFSFIRKGQIVEYRKFKELHKVRCLRTFLSLSTPRQFWKALDSVIVDLLPKLEFLRVLTLNNYFIPEEVPQSIGNLKHLRYLNFSITNIKRIPEEVSELYNLQSLLVLECYQLCSLPISFVKLINLRHLDMASTPLLKKLPLGIGGLTSIQTLSKVVIEGGNGFKISELKGLSNLQGSLSIEGLEKVIESTEANDANLQQKKGLVDLKLVWSDVSHELRDSTNEEVVLEKLRPPCKLKKLSISGYKGMKFPSWLGDPSFDQLTHLGFYGCENCTELPSFEHLTSLEKLVVIRCSKLVSIKGVGSSIMGSLTQMTIWDCDSLESYSCPNSVKKLERWDCSSITSLSFSKLREEVDLPSSSSSSSNLKILRISDCKNIKSISQEHLESLTYLEEIYIHKCPSMGDSFPSSGSLHGLRNLRKLEIGELKKPMSEWGLLNYPSSLVRLILFGKNSGVVSFGAMEQEEDHVRNNIFLLPPSLTELRIIDFEEVESVSEVLQHLPRLQQLTIRDCPKLRDVPHSTSYLRVEVYP